MDWSSPCDALFSVFGSAGTYHADAGDVSVTVIVRDDRDPDLLDPDLVRAEQTVLELKTSECGGRTSVRRGERITVGSTEYTIDRVIDSDDLITRVTCTDRSG